MLGIWKISPCFFSIKREGRISGFCCRAEDQQIQPNELQTNKKKKKKKAVVVGSGWAGLAAAHHLCKQVLQFLFLSPYIILKSVPQKEPHF